MKQNHILIYLLTILILVSVACGQAAQPTSAPSKAPVLADTQVPTRASPPTDTLAPLLGPTAATAASPTPEPQFAEIRQWAASASANSEFSNPRWSAMQAVGAPDTLRCGDIPTAWAAHTYEPWIELTYGIPVIPTQVNIHQSYGQNQVVKVELLDLSGKYHTIYDSDITFVDGCPYILSVPVVAAGYQAVGVKITIDLGKRDPTTWNEIDAVELVGVGDPKATPRALPAASATPENYYELAGGQVWRMGGERSLSDEVRFYLPTDLDVDMDGNLYVIDGMRGIFEFTPEAGLLRIISDEKLINATHIEVDGEGNIYLGFRGAQQIMVLSPQGEEITRFGEAGNGDGQFGPFSPAAITVSSGGAIYALDRNQHENEKEFFRVQVFDAQGNFQNAFPISEADFEPNSIVEAGNYLYFSSPSADYLLQYTLTGEFIERIGEDILPGCQPLDAYVTTLTDEVYVACGASGSIVAFTLEYWPGGQFIDESGFKVLDGNAEWPRGGFYAPLSLAVNPFTGYIFVADISDAYAYITAFEFTKPSP